MSVPLLSAKIKSLWNRLFRRKEVDADLDAELLSAIHLLADQKIKDGMNAHDAFRAAKIELGGVEQVKEDVRASRAGAWLDTLSRDIRFALRMLRKNPGFTATAVFTLALAIGANTAVFSVVNAVLLRPLPYGDFRRVVLLVGSALDTDNFAQWKQQTASYDRFVAVSVGPTTLTTADQSELVQASELSVSPDFFPFVKIQPALGRQFVSADFSTNAHVAIVTDRFWRTSLDSDPRILNRVVLFDKVPFTIIGVLPPNLPPLPYRSFDVLLPLLPQPAKRTEIFAELKPGVSMASAQTEAEAIAERFATVREKSDPPLVRVDSFRDQLVNDSQTVLILLLSAVGVVLLIACGNIASLQLIRFTGRRREIAVRSALGAGRSRLVRQMLVEGLILALMGAGLGLLLAGASMKLLVSAIPIYISRIAESRIDVTVLAFALALTTIVTILSGLVPAREAARFDVSSTLKEEGGHGALSARHQRLRSALVVGQVALATLMLASAGLLVKAFLTIRPAHPGFDPENKLTFRMRIFYPSPAQQVATLHDALDRLNAVPGVRAVAAVSWLPMTGMTSLPDISVDGRVVAGVAHRPFVHYRTSTANFFGLMRMPIVRGRDFADADNEQAAKVAIVNQAAAALLWPHRDAIGQRVTIDRQGKPLECSVVGIVQDARILGITTKSSPELYVPLWQDPAAGTSFVLLTSSDPNGLIAGVRNALHPFGAGVTLTGFDSMSHLLYDSVGEPRFNAQLFATLAGLAFLLAIVGVYGIVSYSVARRTREIGIRMALGAQPGETMRLILVNGLKLASIGIAVGIVGALGIGRLISSLLYGTSSTDPPTFLAVAISLALVATAACYIPARRAMRVDPVSAIRCE